jgi:hypothetical protein
MINTLIKYFYIIKKAQKTFVLLAFFLFTFTFIFTPKNSQAAEIIANTEVNLSNATITENYYVAGGDVYLDSLFEKDLFIVGGSIDLYGEVRGDVTVIGGELNLENNILGDLRVIGGVVNIGSAVNGDLIIVGGEVNLNKNAQIRGETLLIAAELTQNSVLPKENTIIAGSVLLGGDLSGDTSITTQKIVFGNNSAITGSLNYYSPFAAEEIGEVNKTGVINFNEIKTIRETGVVKTAVINIMSFWLILKFITTLIIAFLLIHIFKYFTQKTTDMAIESIFKSFFAGLLSVIAIPFIAIILMLSLIGLPVGFLLLLLYFFVITISTAFSGIIIGTLVYNLFEKEETSVTFQKTTVGIVLLTTLQFVGFLGDISLLIISFISIGAILRFIIGNIVYKR